MQTHWPDPGKSQPGSGHSRVVNYWQVATNSACDWLREPDIGFGWSEVAMALPARSGWKTDNPEAMGNAVGYTNPTDPFNMYLKVSLIMGIFVASPFVLYQIWAFIAPGLYKSERRYVAPFMFSTVGLFVAGGLFAYKMVYPAALDFLIGYSKQFTPQHQ